MVVDTTGISSSDSESKSVTSSSYCSMLSKGGGKRLFVEGTLSVFKRLAISHKVVSSKSSPLSSSSSFSTSLSSSSSWSSSKKEVEYSSNSGSRSRDRASSLAFIAGAANAFGLKAGL